MKHLTAADRGRIEVLLHLKHNNAAIARKLGKHKSTIGREIVRGTNHIGIYTAEYAHASYAQNRQRSYNRPKLTKHPELSRYVRERITSGWDPSQIAGRLRVTNATPRVTTETIYRWIYEDPRNKATSFYQYLRYGKKKRGYARTSERTVQQFKLRNRVSIHDRPPIVNDRVRLGDWEADTVLYPHRQLIVTAYERTSSLALFCKLPTKQTRVVCPALGAMLAATVAPKTVTVDNGVEFHRHKDITEASGAHVYFADTYASQQRGGNENLNRQLRAFLPRGYNITDVTQQEIKDIQDELNNKARGRLRWRTPNEVYGWLAQNPNKPLDLSMVAFDVGS